MPKTKSLQVFIILLTGILFSPLINAAYIDYDDTWYENEGTNDDAAVWGGYSLDVGLNSLTSNADAICWDWDGDGQYSHCSFKTGVSEYACDDNFYITSEPSGNSVPLSDLYNGHCSSFGDESCENPIGTGSSGQTWNLYVDALYFEDCDGSASYTGVTAQEYWVVYGHQYDCDSVPGPSTDPDYEGHFNSDWLNILPNTGRCSASQECDENHDEIVSYTSSATPSDPCRTKNGYSCSANSDCISDICLHGICRSTTPYCGDTYCDFGENIDDTYQCVSDCCDNDCTSYDDSVCHSECHGYNNCSLTSGCDNCATGNTCMGPDYYKTCCEGTSTTYCDSDEYCSGGSCHSCSASCDNSCQSSACYGPDPDCDASGNPTAICCGDGLCEGSENIGNCYADCYNVADLQILNIIPIQVVPDVEMVYDKSGFVKVIAINNGPNVVSGTVSATFNGQSLTPNGTATKNMSPNQNVSFYFNFNPYTTGLNLIINATIS